MQIENQLWTVHPNSELDRTYLEGLVRTVVASIPGQLDAGTTSSFRTAVRERLSGAGWSSEARIASGFDLSVFALYNESAFQVQCGNVSRVAYDLLKLQFLFSSGRITAAALMLPMKVAAGRIGSNVANYERTAGELRLFSSVVTLPILLVGVL